MIVKPRISGSKLTLNQMNCKVSNNSNLDSLTAPSRVKKGWSDVQTDGKHIYHSHLLQGRSTKGLCNQGVIAYGRQNDGSHNSGTFCHRFTIEV